MGKVSKYPTSSGIYCFRNKINDKKYIGQSSHLNRRITQHISFSKKENLPRGENPLLFSAIKKYGLENFEILILEECPVSKLNDREIYYIELYESHRDKKGYNITFGGDKNPRGFKHSYSAIERIRKALFERGEVSEETRKKLSVSKLGEKNPSWGKSLSDETKRKMSEKTSGEKSPNFGKKSLNSSSNYFGVSISRQGKYVYWVVYINTGSNKKYLGQSKDEENAARIYDKYVIENNLPHPLNFPKGV